MMSKIASVDGDEVPAGGFGRAARGSSIEAKDRQIGLKLNSRTAGWRGAPLRVGLHCTSVADMAAPHPRPEARHPARAEPLGLLLRVLHRQPRAH